MKTRRMIGIAVLVAGLLALVVWGVIDLRLYLIVHSVRQDVLG